MKGLLGRGMSNWRPQPWPWAHAPSGPADHKHHKWLLQQNLGSGQTTAGEAIGKHTVVLQQQEVCNQASLQQEALVPLVIWKRDQCSLSFLERHSRVQPPLEVFPQMPPAQALWVPSVQSGPDCLSSKCTPYSGAMFPCCPPLFPWAACQPSYPLNAFAVTAVV